MPKANKQLNVLMNGVLVGRLVKSSSGSLVFSYESSWLGKEDARPISLSLPLSTTNHQDEKVYNFFDNLLPDNPRIRARIQARFQAVSEHPFDLLAHIGRDCVGAIQISDESDGDVKHIDALPISNKEIAHVLQNYREAPLGMSHDQTDFRISIAGAQEKSALLFHKGKWCWPLGTTPTSHIFKLPIGMIEHQQMDLSDSCENEWLCTKIAEAFGLPVAQSEIQKFDGVKVLVVERFDRKLSSDCSWIMRLPQEDMCQALGYSPNLKYESDGGPGITKIMKLLMDSEEATDDRALFFRYQVLFWLLAAIDGHAKNFSVFIEAGGRFRLTPLYDVMSAYPLIAKKQLQKQKIKMAMALIGKNKHYHHHSMQRRHFISTADTANLSTEHAQNILDDMLSRVDDVISNVSKQLPSGFPAVIADSMFEGMNQMQRVLRK